MKNTKIEKLSVTEMLNTKGGSQQTASLNGIGGCQPLPGPALPLPIRMPWGPVSVPSPAGGRLIFRH